MQVKGERRECSDCSEVIYSPHRLSPSVLGSGDSGGHPEPLFLHGWSGQAPTFGAKHCMVGESDNAGLARRSPASLEATQKSASPFKFTQ